MQRRNSHTVRSFDDPCRAVRVCVETPRPFLYHASSLTDDRVATISSPHYSPVHARDSTSRSLADGI